LEQVELQNEEFAAGGDAAAPASALAPRSRRQAVAEASLLAFLILVQVGWLVLIPYVLFRAL